MHRHSSLFVPDINRNTLLLQRLSEVRSLVTCSQLCSNVSLAVIFACLDMNGVARGALKYVLIQVLIPLENRNYGEDVNVLIVLL